MDDRVRRFRSKVQKLGGSGRGRRYPKELRDLAVSHWIDSGASGAPLRSVAAELGLPEGTLQRWIAASDVRAPAVGLQEVVLAEVADADAPVLALVTPDGYRIEGLSLPEVISLLRSLA